MMKLRWIMSLFWLSLTLLAESQPVKGRKVRPLFEVGTNIEKITGDSIIYDRSYLLPSILDMYQLTEKESTEIKHNLKYNLYLENLTLLYKEIPDRIMFSEPESFSIPGYLLLFNCRADSLPIAITNLQILDGLLNVKSVQFPSLKLDNVAASTIMLQEVEGVIEASRINCNELFITNPSASRVSNNFKYDIFIENSALRAVNLFAEGKRIDLQKDSVLEGIKLSPPEETETKRVPYKVLRFENCYVDGGFTFDNYDTVRINRLIFVNCSFGPQMKLTNLIVDTVAFYNCGILPASLNFNLNNDRTDTRLFLYNTSFDVANFNYSSHTKLIFPSEISGVPDYQVNPDLISNTYETIIDKYAGQKMYNKAEIIDLQYRAWKAKQGNWLVKTGYFLQDIWWNFGYRKHYILLWTLAFLSLFSVLNAIWWQDMNDTYPLTPAYSSRWSMRVVSVLIFTSYIFFSLRVDFAKLKFNKTRFVLLFFLQYMIGLTCLFFIFNALLKW